MSSPAPDGETPTQKAARLRREKRQGRGGDRLKAIVGIDKRELPTDESSAAASASSSRPTSRPPKPATPPPPYSETHDDAPDPDTSDISTHNFHDSYDERTGQWNNSGSQQQPQRRAGPFTPGPNAMMMPPGQDQEQDPMLALFQSLMNPSASHDPADPNSPEAQIPAALAALMNGGAIPPDFQARQQADASRTEATLKSFTLSTSTWRLIHFASALILSFFALTSSPARFTGSQAARGMNVASTQLGSQLFMYFAAVEAVLLSTRLFLERGKPLEGILGTVIGLLPGSFGTAARVLMRYATIGSSVVQDALVVVWVIGMVGWWNGLKVA